MIRKLRAGHDAAEERRGSPIAPRGWRSSPRSRRRSTRRPPRRIPGRRSFQRLNRAEYAAAIEALFGIDVDVAAYLPADTISASFDNIADVQMPSATVMQGYMRAAVVRRAAPSSAIPSADPSSTTYEVPRTQSQKDRVEGAPFGTRGGTVVTHNFLADGKYKFQLLLHGEPTGAALRPHGRRRSRWKSRSTASARRSSRSIAGCRNPIPTGSRVTTGPDSRERRPAPIAATFIREFEGEEDDLIKPIDHTLADTQIGVGYGVTTLPHLRNLAIVGPFDVTGVSDNPARQTVFSCRPTKPDEARAVRASRSSSAWRPRRIAGRSTARGRRPS